MDLLSKITLLKECFIATVSQKNSNFPKANQEITSSSVRVVDADGTMVGVLPLKDALKLAADRGLDLVEISPTATPPVCKILDYGKFKYAAQKRAHDARKKQKVIDIKEIKLRPNIGQNDYEVKLRSIQTFLKEGNKVKISLRFKGREITHQELGFKILERMQQDLLESAKVELSPRMEGKQLLMILIPIK